VNSSKRALQIMIVLFESKCLISSAEVSNECRDHVMTASNRTSTERQKKSGVLRRPPKLQQESPGQMRLYVSTRLCLHLVRT
jgi:hypothetical protein